MPCLKFFSNSYTVRKFLEEGNYNGYSAARYRDIQVTADVQPLSPDDLKILPEGERVTKRIKAYSDYTFTAADEDEGTRGDLLNYDGKWYKCVSSLTYGHTAISHCKAQFVEIRMESDDQ